MLSCGGFQYDSEHRLVAIGALSKSQGPVLTSILPTCGRQKRAPTYSVCRMSEHVETDPYSKVC